MTGARRGRPRSTDRRTPVTRDLIAERGLAIAGAEGFGALTMHRLAGDLDVTPRALYNHVRDRQEVIDLVATLMMRRLPSSTLDPVEWRSSLRSAYQEARAVYRQFPRATLISLDETVTTAAIDPRRVTSSEAMLRFLTDIGLTLPQALTVRGSFLIDVFGFVLLIDYRYDRGDAAARRAVAQPVRRDGSRRIPTSTLRCRGRPLVGTRRTATPCSTSWSTCGSPPSSTCSRRADLRVASVTGRP